MEQHEINNKKKGEQVFKSTGKKRCLVTIALKQVLTVESEIKEKDKRYFGRYSKNEDHGESATWWQTR